MSNLIEADICVIGAGSGGLSVASGAAQLGMKTVLIEKGKMGGDCLNYGCVPSKSLIAAGERAHAMRSSEAFGISPVSPKVDFGKVQDHVTGVIAAIAPHDSQERFEGLGCTVIRAPAKFISDHEVEAGDTKIRAKTFVVATGSGPMVPPIPGLDDVPYFTNETLFDNREQPDHLIVVGGGPIGMEMAQAHHRLGSDVTVVERSKVLPKDDSDLTEILIDQLKDEGINILERADVNGVEKTEGGIAVLYNKDGQDHRLEGSHLLVATGRRPNIESLDLDAAGIAFDRKGIKVDARLRTSNKRVFAIGDVAGGLQFTHVAGYHAGIVIRNALFKLPAKADTSAAPWVTYTDPELAHVGMTEEDAQKVHGKSIKAVTWPLKDNDRAQAERRTEGMIKVITDKRGKILGASIVGAHAGELIQPWILGVAQKMKISAFAGMIAPYPTLGEIGKRAAGAYYTPSLFSKRTRWLVRLLSKIG